MAADKTGPAANLQDSVARLYLQEFDKLVGAVLGVYVAEAMEAAYFHVVKTFALSVFVPDCVPIKNHFSFRLVKSLSVLSGQQP
jgi:hypothetical protein